MDTVWAVLLGPKARAYSLAEQMKPHSPERFMENHQEDVTASQKPIENSKPLAEKPKSHKDWKVI